MIETAIKKWGNSQGVRLPKSILEEAHFNVSDTVMAETDGTCIILRKKFKHKTFSERLAEYDGKIEPCNFDWGDPVGREGI